MTPILTFHLLLLSGLLLALAVFWPGAVLELVAGLGPVGLFMPAFVTSTCPAYCSTMASSVSITWSGIANGTCTQCGDYNTTVVVTTLTGGGCKRQSAGSVTSCDLFLGSRLAISDCGFLSNGSGGVLAAVNFDMNNSVGGFGPDSALLHYDFGGTAPIDCSATGSFSPGISTFTSYNCDMSAISAVVVPS